MLSTPPTFTSPRLEFRELRLANAQGLLHIFGDEKTMYYTDTEPLQTVAQAVAEIEWMAQLKAKEHGIRWGLFLKTDQTLIGTAGYHKWDKNAQKAEIGYEVGSPYWRKGYMTETFPLLLRYGFEQMSLQQVEALVIQENIPSIGLLKKFNFRQVGLLREHCFQQNIYRDELVFALRKSEWRMG